MRIYQKEVSVQGFKLHLLLTSALGILFIYILNNLAWQNSLSFGVGVSMARALTLGTVSFLIAVIWGMPLINLLKRW